MRVVVEGGDFFDLRQQALINLLDIGSGERASLGGGENGKEAYKTEQRAAYREKWQSHGFLGC
jgi:hypothetical protein